MNYEFRKVTEEDVKDILTWKYEGVYSFFDNDAFEGKANYIKSLVNNENAYSVYNDKNELIGNCEIYLKDKVTFALQMRPSLTSKGLGKDFGESIINFFKEQYNLKTIGLSVLKFNERAFRLYKSLGFKITHEFIGKTVKGEMDFIAMEKAL